MILLGMELVLIGSAVVALGSDWPNKLSALMRMCSGTPDVNSELARDAFANAVLPPPHLVEGHTHPSAAAKRASATLLARDMATNLGVEVYSIEMSKSDQRHGLRGCREWRWAKDTNVQNRNDLPKSDDLVYICDVDYYMDMPDLLTKGEKPVLIYSVVPEAAASNTVDDSSFTFNSEGELETTVAGGGFYRHHLWDYAGDSLKVVKRVCGIPIRTVTYSIERRQVGYSRQLILLSPIKVFWSFSAVVANWLIAGKELERFDPIVKGKDGSLFIRFKVQASTGAYYTTARPGNLLVANIKADIDEAIATVARLGTTNLQLPTTASWVGKDERQAAAVLTEYHRLVVGAKIPTVFPVSIAVRAYAFEPITFSQDEKPKVQAFMSPLVHEAFAVVPNAAAERQCVKGRINDLKKPEPKLTPFIQRAIEEFVAEVVNGCCLEPAGVEEIIQKQRRAQQQQSLKRAVVAGPFFQNRLLAFIKGDAVANLSDPRNISTYNDRDKLEMAQFAMSLAGHMKQFEWYGPGKNPVEIAQRVADICSDAETVNVSDYHRMDGTITYLLRKVDRAIFMAAFPNHRLALNELFKTNADNYGVLPKGTTYEQGSSHGSGCSATSVSQTIRAAFAAYLGYRNKYRSVKPELSHRMAFDSLGIHLGDDGLDADLPVSNLKWAARSVGLVLEAGSVSRGHRGVNFLARFYSPEVWNGRVDSMCDVKRQLGKLHVTLRMPDSVTPGAKLVEKAMGYVATDSNTPIIGAFCHKAVATSSAELKRVKHGVASWWSQFDQSVQFPNVNDDGWMDTEFSVQFPEFDRDIFGSWLESVKTADQLLCAPVCAEPKRPNDRNVDVVVDGDVQHAVEPPASEDPPAPDKQDKKDTGTPDASTTLKRESSRKRKAKRSQDASQPPLERLVPPPKSQEYGSGGKSPKAKRAPKGKPAERQWRKVGPKTTKSSIKQ